MKSIIEQFNTLRVLVIGDIMLDVYDFCYTSESRPSPEKEDARVYRAQQQVKALGGAGNVAANCASLGAKTTLLGLCGNDAHFFQLKKLAEQQGIEHVFIRDDARPTTVKTRLYIDDEYILRRDDESAEKVNSETALTIRSEVGERLDQIDVVILSDYNKGLFVEADSQSILRMCAKRKIPVIIDFKPQNDACFKGAPIIALNLAEAKTLLSDFDFSAPAQVEALRNQLNAGCLAVTLGGKGILGADGIDCFRVPGHEVAVSDPVGCGDTVHVLLALGVAAGLDFKQAVSLANDAGALVVQKLGTATLNGSELMGMKL